MLNSYFANRVDGRFAYGPAQGMPDDQPMDMAGLARVKRDWMSGDGLLTLGICSRNIGAMSIGGATRGTLTVEMAKRDWGGARALGLPITLHTSGASPIKLLEEAGLLGSDVQLVHPLLTTPEERAILKARGVSYATAPVGRRKRLQRQIARRLFRAAGFSHPPKQRSHVNRNKPLPWGNNWTRKQ